MPDAPVPLKYSKQCSCPHPPTWSSQITSSRILRMLKAFREVDVILTENSKTSGAAVVYLCGSEWSWESGKRSFGLFWSRSDCSWTPDLRADHVYNPYYPEPLPISATGSWSRTISCLAETSLSSSMMPTKLKDPGIYCVLHRMWQSRNHVIFKSDIVKIISWPPHSTHSLGIFFIRLIKLISI